MDETQALRLVTTREGAVRFEIQARPRARTSQIVGVRGGALVVGVAAPPVDGAANLELASTLATALDVPKREVVLVRGENSRKKLVEVRGVTVDAVRERLEKALVEGATR